MDIGKIEDVLKEGSEVKIGKAEWYLYSRSYG